MFEKIFIGIISLIEKTEKTQNRIQKFTNF